jgi:hypothetical protein
MNYLNDLLKRSIAFEQNKKSNMVNLTEFSYSQLMTFFDAVNAYQESLKDHVYVYESRGLGDEPMFQSVLKPARQKIQDCQVVAIQIMSAMQIVSEREQVASN